MADDDAMQVLYQWIDDIPLSRPKRSISRDFSDGVLAAELVIHFFPKLVDLHNYSAANSVSQKQYNWKTLNQKVFKKMGFQIHQDDIKGICDCTPGAIERVLTILHSKVTGILQNGGKLPNGPAQKPRRVEVPASAPAAKHKRAPGPAQGDLKPGQRQPASQPVPRHRQNLVSNSAKPAPAAHQKPRAGKQEEEEVLRPTYHIPLMQPGGQPPRQAGAPVTQKPPRVNMMADLGSSAKIVQDDLPESSDLDTEILIEKETTIEELRETVLILETKIQKMEQLLGLKDQKINKLMSALETRGGAI
eukprot:TRINITY_DN10313_c0_g1_i1.p1 TRINITY_DN10313_c0_g1~~TRINITY_DN10313_c0_g1_i1.p1  ORF type:complete len:304 (+),score=71.05 TRINITY_DN10313_c0_g1_i1:227-1138(+)